MKQPEPQPTKTPPDSGYPYYKTVAWRFIRGAVWGGIANLGTVAFTLKPDFSNYQLYVSALITAFITGAGTAIGLAVRDSISNGDKSAAVQKLPL